jgi:GT2 family glycosyltransferase
MEISSGKKKASIIIPVCNQLSTTRLCVQGIADNTGTDFEIVVVDNGSTDGTPGYFEDLRNRLNVRVLRNSENEGAIRAINQGLSAATGEYACVMHNDVVIRENGWLEKMTSLYEKDGSFGLAGFAGRRFIDKKARVDESTLVHSLTNEGLDTPPMVKKAEEVAVVDGLCLFSRLNLFKEVGCLDEVYEWMHFYDLDISFKFLKAGYKNIVINVKCYHINNGGNTRFSEDYKKIVSDDAGLLNKNSAIFRKKWKNFLPQDKRNGAVITE